MPKKAWGADLYLVTAGELTKLGRSQHPHKRLQELQRGVPWLQCKLYAIFPTAGFLEAGLHKDLTARFQRHGEWYVCTAAQVAETCVARLKALEAGGASPPDHAPEPSSP